MFLFVKTIYVLLYFVLYIFHQEYSKNSRSHETKILCKIFFTSNFAGNARQPAGLSRGDSKAGGMESGERDLSNSPPVDYRVSYIDMKCLGNLNQLFHSFLSIYIMKTARSTMMSPRDKMHVIELLVAKEHLYIHLKGIFQCIIMLCNQNERQRQSKQMFCVCVTMICRKWSPRDNILFMIILHPQTDISGYQQLRRQYKRQYLWSKVKKYIFLS